MSARPSLITDHWFREGPIRPDGTDGYWICDLCGQHRGDHLQAEGHWLKPLHPFVSLVGYRPSYCRTCGRHQRHTTHTPWTWGQLEKAASTSTAVAASPLPERRRVPCSFVALRLRPHQPHDWEPQPGMEPVHCPGFTDA